MECVSSADGPGGGGVVRVGDYVVRESERLSKKVTSPLAMATLAPL